MGTDAETWWFIFGQQFCVVLVYTALEIREDFILADEENSNRGTGTDWPRKRVHLHVYILYPIVWTVSFAGILLVAPANSLFPRVKHVEQSLMMAIRLTLFFP